MLEFLMLLSARFHAQVHEAALDIARAAMHDPIINITRSIEAEVDTLAHATRTWGMIVGLSGYLIAAPDGWRP